MPSLTPIAARGRGIRFTGRRRLYAPVVYVDPFLVAPAPTPYIPYWDRLPYACGVYGYC